MKNTDTLRNLQRQFSSAVLCEHGIVTHNLPANYCTHISGQLTTEQLLNIYRNNVVINFREALKAVYPVIHKLVGEAFFNAMAREYMVKHPSRSGNLHEFGNQLSEFISGFDPAGDLVYLSDVAKLEWAYHAVFHAENRPAFDLDKLKNVETSRYQKIKFILSPASRLIRSSFPILRIWETNQDNRELSEPANAQPDTISLDEGQARILVLRDGLDINFLSLSDPEYNFLKALDRHEDFFSACDAATKTDPDYSVGPLLQKHILCGSIVDFEIAE